MISEVAPAEDISGMGSSPSYYISDCTMCTCTCNIISLSRILLWNSAATLNVEMFVPTTKCVIPIWLKLLCKHRKPHWAKYDSRLFLLFHFFYERHGKKTIFGKHLTFRSFHCFSREMKWKSLSQLWQIAVQSALNLEIYHCFPLRPFFTFSPKPCEYFSPLPIKIIFTMFWFSL